MRGILPNNAFIGFLLASLLTVLPGILPAQVTPPAAYPTNTNVNYKRIWRAMAPDQSPAHLITRPLTDVEQTTQYYDGMGRPQQTVLKQGSLVTNPASPGSSTGSTDIVATDVYDATGRETYTYLHFAMSAAQSPDVTNDGNFKLSPFQQQIAFYNAQLTGQTGETNVGSGNLNWAYEKTNYDQTPLNRVVSSLAPGVNWVGSEAGSTPHATQKGYFINTSPDNVQKWNITMTQGSIPTSSGAYAAGALYKIITTNERGLQTIEFRDEDDQLILRKEQFTAAADNGTGSAHAGWLCTYYVYDDYGNMRFIITPQVVQAIDGSWAIAQPTADALCYRFEYDQLNRIEIKKQPGAAELWIVYDARNRPIMLQDANLRLTNQWWFVKYDGLDRMVVAGLVTDNVNTTLAAQIAAMTSSAMGLYEQRTTANSIGYTLNQTYPVVGTTLVVQALYYDDYGWTSGYGSQLAAKNNTYDGQFAPANNTTFPYPQPLTQAPTARARLTGAWGKLQGTYAESSATGVIRALYYDNQGRPNQVQDINITGGTDISTTQYSWSGKPLQVVTVNQKSGTNAQSYTLTSMMTYDPEWRLLTSSRAVSGTVNGVAVTAPAQVVVSNQYDALGHLKTKALGSLETLSYDYNVRNWPLGFNRQYIGGAPGTHYFGLDLGYDNSSNAAGTTSYAAQQYNGNLAGATWKSAGDGIARKYDFTYDADDRLAGANYLQNTTGANWDQQLLNFSVTGVAYSANGNLQNMSQYGYLIGQSGLIDNLTYTYGNSGNSNQLAQVYDAANNSSSTLGDLHYTGSKTVGSSIDYTYDPNGNLSTDANKGFTAITYNYLNLPLNVPVTGKGNVSYVYDAFGNKLAKVTADNATGLKTTTTYISQFIYQSQVHTPTVAGDFTDALQYIQDPEGRIRPITPSTYNGNKSFAFDYYIKDHLGDLRMVLTDEKQQDLNIPAATFEDGTAGTLTTYYTVSNGGNITANANIPGGYSTNVASYPNNNGITNPDTDPAINTSAASGHMYKIPGGSTQPTDLGITIKVTSGDMVNLYGRSYYFTNGVTPTNTNLIQNALNGFVGAFTGTGGFANGFAHGAATAASALENSTNPLYSALQGAFTNMPGTPAGAPRAGLNWILFDNQLNAVASNSSSIQVGIVGTGALGNLSTTVNISKSGYLYVYCSNESSNIDVYFDNLQVVNNRGPILEEAHYYPFGLTIAALSSVAQNKPENKNKFNNGSELQHHEFSDGSGLELYDASYRMYDPQTGRFNGIDLMAASNAETSPYAFVKNNPLIYSDQLGLDTSTPGWDTGDGADDNSDDEQDNLDTQYTVIITPDGAYATGTDNSGGPDKPNGAFVYDPSTKSIYFDPNINGPGDLPTGSTLQFLGGQISVTQNGVTTWYEASNGSFSSTTTNPNWGDLNSVYVSGHQMSAMEKANMITALTADATILPLDVAKGVARAAVGGAMERTLKKVAGGGAILSGFFAAKHLLSGHGDWHDVLAVGLAGLTVALLFSPEGAIYEAAAVIVDVATTVNDTWSDVKAMNEAKEARGGH
jgi:RHS repeat-associated protein